LPSQAVLHIIEDTVDENESAVESGEHYVELNKNWKEQRVSMGWKFQILERMAGGDGGRQIIASSRGITSITNQQARGWLKSLFGNLTQLFPENK
jgi:hypothetical protein